MRHNSLIFGLLAVAGFCGVAGYAQNKVVKVVPAQPANSAKGVDLYGQYCAACHGTDGRGHGPAADALRTAPTDLTMLARRNEGKFDAVHLRILIVGSDAVTAHGSANMPVWGSVFKSTGENATFAEMRVNALVEHLRTLQR